MTPEEEAVIAAAIEWHQGEDPEEWRDSLLIESVRDLLASRRPPEPVAVWVPATFADCLGNDRIRLNGEEAIVLRATRGIWHADTRDEWRPKAWDHVEVRLALDVVPELSLYPPNGPIEILMTEERRAVHIMSQAFPGTVRLP